MAAPKRSGNVNAKDGGPEGISEETSADRCLAKVRSPPFTELDRDRELRLELEKSDERGPLDDRG
jgi:hypothetical protein